MEDIEYSGLWWIPSNSEKKIAGTLVFSNQDGIDLSLIGSFTHPVGFISDHMEDHQLILGVTVEGKLLTLFNCQASGSRSSSPGFTSQQYTVGFVFVGGHLSDLEQLRFRKLRVKPSRLADWVRVSGFSVPSHEEPYRTEFAYSLPEELTATTVKGTVSLTYTLNTTRGLEKVVLRQSTWIKVELNEELSLEDLQDQYIRPLQNFLTLATSKPNFIIDLEVYSKHVTHRSLNGKFELPLQVLFQQTYYETVPSKLLRPDELLFTLSDIKSDFGSVIERWLYVSKDLDAVLNLFFSIRYIPIMYLEQEFLSVIQALETYHRRRKGNSVLPKAQHNARIKVILDQAPEEYQEWLKEQLNYSNEPRLRQRLRELIDEVEPVIPQLIDDKEEFVKKVTNTRNFYTHYDDRLQAQAAKEIDLLHITEKLSYILQACFLHELGITQEKCIELFRRNRGYLWAVKR